MIKKKKQKSTLKKSKDKAWSAFSLFIRLRGVKEYLEKHPETNEPLAECVTCDFDKVRHYKELQAGHWIGGRKNAVLFDEETVFPQCYGCNVMQQGRGSAYGIFMNDKYGSEKVKELYARKFKEVKYNEEDYKNIEREYIVKYSLLADELGIDI